MFADMKLSVKLACAFGVVLVLTALIGGLGVFQLAHVNRNVEDFATNLLPSVKALGELRNAANAFRRLENRHLLAFDDKEMDAIEVLMAQAKQGVAAAQKKYEAVLSAEEKATYEELKARFEAYWATSAKLLPLSRGGEATLNDAKAFLRGASNDALQAVLDTQAKLLEINEKDAVQSYAEAQSAYASARLWVVGLLLGTLAACIACAFLIIRTITRQLGGEPAYAAEVAKRIAGGDLSLSVDVKANDNGSMLAAMKGMQQRLTDIVREIKGSSDTISSATSQIAAGNADLSQRTEEQASSLEETASSMEELTGTVKQNAENARQANQLAAGASTMAVKGGEVVGQVVNSMSSINESSKKIADIISVIDGIAFQTNILALNAAVEAARAGEQGRGFAVVASEVRTLAQRSAAAAKEIKALITDSVAKVEDGSKLVDHAGQAMEEIVTAVKRVTDIMAEIAAASHEQSSGIEQVNQAIVQMDQVTQQNAALVEESAAAAESMQEQAQSLTRAVAVFKLDAGHAHAAAPRSAQPEMERRGPGRARNVTRLPKPEPKGEVKSAPQPKRAKAANGEASWQEF